VQVNVGPVIDRLFRKQCRVDAIDEMRTHVGQRFPLLRNVEKPWGPLIGHPGDLLHDVVDACRRHPGICARSQNRIAKHFRIFAQQTCQSGDGRLSPA
jgi:hypothetical protein